MTSTFTPNRNLEQPGNDDYVGSWDVPVNANWAAIDACLGTLITVATTGGSTILTTAQMQNLGFIVSGALTSAATILLPAAAGGVYQFINVTTGATSVTIGTTSGGSTVSIGQGQFALILSNAGNVVLANSVDAPSDIQNSQLAAVPNQTFKGNLTGGTATPQDYTLSQLAAALAGGLAPAGKLDFFAMQTAPGGWLPCDGSAVSRTTFAALFGAIGTQYGPGDGSTTFNVPDNRGEFIRSWDTGAGRDPGRAFGSHQTDAMIDHTHVGTIASTAPASPNIAGGGSFSLVNSNQNTSFVNSPNGGGAETRPKNAAYLLCIKT